MKIADFRIIFAKFPVNKGSCKSGMEVYLSSHTVIFGAGDDLFFLLDEQARLFVPGRKKARFQFAVLARAINWPPGEKDRAFGKAARNSK